MVNTFCYYGFIVSGPQSLGHYLPSMDGKVDIEIIEMTIPEIPSEPTNVFRRNSQASIALTSTCVFLHWPEVGKFQIRNGHSIYFERQCPESILYPFLLAEVFGLCLFQRGLYILHAGAVVIQNKAFIICGESGTGKSTTTLALLQKGASFMADDMAVLDVKNGKVYVLPSMGEMKIWQHTVEMLDISTENLLPLWEEEKKYRFKPQMGSMAKVKLGGFLMLQEKPKQNSFLSLTSFFALPNNILIAASLQHHFKQTAVLASFPITHELPPRGRQELLAWADSFIRNA